MLRKSKIVKKSKESKQRAHGLTGLVVVAGEAERAREELQSDDGVDDDDEEDEQRNVEQGDHCHQDGVQHHLQT